MTDDHMFRITDELTGPSAEHVRNIALMAAVIGSSDSILNWTHNPDDLIDVAARIYSRTARRYMEEMKSHD